MPRYYCDYCDTHLTHDSPSVRKQHNAGYKHKANVRTYYQQFEEQQTQSFIDQKVKEHLGQAGYPHVGAAFHQHLNTFQTRQYRPPVALPPPPGSTPGVIRPPVLPRPAVPAPGYGAPPGIGTPTIDMNGFARPSGLPGGSNTMPPPSFPGLSPNNSMPSANGFYANAAPASSGNSVSYGFPSGNQYSSQQTLGPLGPPGTYVQSDASRVHSDGEGFHAP